MRKYKWGTVLLLLGALSAPAAAEPGGALDVERFDLTLDDSAILNVEGAEAKEPETLVFSGFVGFANDPLVVKNLTTDERDQALVHDRYDGELALAYSLLPQLQIGASLPLLIYQNKDMGNGDVGFGPSSTGHGDLGLHGKLYLAQKQPFDLALEAGTTLPTGDSNRYIGGDAYTLKLGAALGKRFGAVRALANAGVVLTSEDQTVGDLEADHELYGRLGLAYRVGRSELGASYSQTTKLSDPFNRVNRDYSELMGGLTRYYDSGISPFVGAGFGINEGYGAPDYRVFAGFHYEMGPKPKKVHPSPPPDEEPPPPDEEPPPPTEPPANKVIIIDDSYFKFDSSTLTAGAESMIQQIASDILSTEGAEVHLQLTGHTDSIGRAAYNARLGMRRAEAVAKALCANGIHKDWVTLVSLGESSPRATNKTVAGRAANRRVEISVSYKKGVDVDGKHSPPDGSTDDPYGNLPNQK